MNDRLFIVSYIIRTAKQMSKSEVCIATSMSVKTRNSCPASPALSIPRSRDVFQDMEVLRMSRHDNPYLQVSRNKTVNFYDILTILFFYIIIYLVIPYYILIYLTRNNNNNVHNTY